MSEENNNEIEVSGLDKARESIRISYSIDPDAFAARFQPVGDNITDSLDNFKSSNNVSTNFQKFSDEITEAIKAASRGQTVEERTESVTRLKDRRALLNDLDTDSGLSDTEISALNQTFEELIKEIKPRAFVSRVQEGAKTAAAEFASGIGSELQSTVGSLQSGLESFGDEFPPLRFALEKSNQIMNALVGGIFNQTKNFIKRRGDRKKEAKLFRIETQNQKTSALTPQKQTVELDNKSIKRVGKEVGKESSNTNPIQTAALTAGLLSMTRGNKERKRKDKPNMLMRILPVLAAGVGLVVSLLGSMASALFSLPGLIIGVVGAIGVVGKLLSGKIFGALKGIGGKLAGFGKSVAALGKNIISSGVSKIKKGVGIAKNAVGKRVAATKTLAIETGKKIGQSVSSFLDKSKTIFQKGKDKVTKVVDKASGQLKKPLVKGAAKVAALVAGGIASAPVGAAIAIGGSLYLLYQGSKAAIKQPGDLMDKLKAGSTAVADELLFNLPSTFSTGGKMEDGKPQKAPLLGPINREEIKNVGDSLKMSQALIEIENAQISGAFTNKQKEELQKTERVRQAGRMNKSATSTGAAQSANSTSIINSTNNNNALINRTTPDNPEPIQRIKSAEGFAS